MMKNMKKIFTVLASLCLAFVMVVSLTGCGSDKDYDNVQEYLDAQKDQIDAAIKQTEGSGMTMEIKAEGDDTLVYRYIYDEAIEVTDDVTAYFDSSMETNKATFDSVLDEMAELIDVKSPKVKLSYENPDGSIVYTYTFTK